MTGLDVAVTSFNTRALLQECLQALCDYPPSLPIHITVVDNGSTDGSVAMVREKFPEVELVAFAENRGFGVATNHALRHLQYETVLLLNADARVAPGAIDAMREYLSERPEVGAVGPQQQTADGRYQISCGNRLTLPGEVFRWLRHRQLRHLNATDAGACRRQTGGRVGWVSGSAMLIRREALRRAGLFDENFFLYFEDIDLCLRFAKVGFAVHYLPAAVVVHHGGASAAAHRPLAEYEYRRSQLYYWRKHGSVLCRGVVRTWLALRSAGLLTAGRLGIADGGDQQKRVLALVWRGPQ